MNDEEIKYQYLPLPPNSIRVLDLHPGSFFSKRRHSPIHVSINIISLTSVPQYEAISYVWGPQDVLHNIHCLDAHGIRVLKVGENLYRALLRLRPDRQTSGQARRLWIDQICINQDNIAERNAQVTLMGQIFEHAERTVVWLGEEDHDTKLACDFLHKHARRVHDEEWVKKIQTQRRTACGLVATLEIACRPWFRRVWTFQEAAMAREILILCGSHIIQWNDLVHMYGHTTAAAAILVGSFYDKELDRRNISHFPRLTHYTEKRDVKVTTVFDLYGLLEATRSYECTDPHERIFALLSTAEPGARQAIAINYEAPVDEVYLDVALYLIQTRRSLSSLYRTPCGKFESRKEDVSWVAHWSDRLPGTPFHCRMEDSRSSIYRATLNLPIRMNHKTPRYRLTVKGIIQGCVAHQCHVDDEQEKHALVASAFNVDYPPTRQDAHVAMLQTLVADRWGETKSINRLIYLGLLHPSQGFMDETYEGDMRNLRQNSGSNAGYGTFFISDAGYMGMGTLGVVPGDCIVL